MVVAVAALIVSSLIFGVVTAAVVHGGGVVTSVDTSVLDAVIAMRRPWLTELAKLVTTLGTGLVVYGLLVGVGLIVWRRTGRWLPTVVAVATLALGQAVRLAISDAVARARPPTTAWLVHPAGHAYPSGHTTTAVIAYGLLAWLAIPLIPGRREPVVAAACLLAAAVGLSRVYLGVHWFSDVVGGWALGAAWLGLVAVLVYTVRDRRRQRLLP